MSPGAPIRPAGHAPPGRGAPPDPADPADPAPAAPAAPQAEEYLADVMTRLPGPARHRAGIIAELRAGLLDATDAYLGAGLSAEQAGRLAIREFGDPARVATSFHAEIAAAQSRKVAGTLLLTGPLVGLLWIATALGSHLDVSFIMPWHHAGSPATSAGLLLVAAAVAVTVCAATVSLGSTGRLTRWLPDRPRRAPTASAIAGFGAIGADGLGLAFLAAQLVVAPGRLSPALACAAAAASLARVLMARRAASHCLALRAALA